MTQPTPTGDESVKAEHGARSEVNWDDGRGSEPYANQDPAGQEPPGVHEVEEGDRGAAAGRNLEQLEAVRGKP